MERMDVCLQFEDVEVKFMRPGWITECIHRNIFLSRNPKESEGMMRDRQAGRQTVIQTDRQTGSDTTKLSLCGAVSVRACFEAACAIKVCCMAVSKQLHHAGLQSTTHTHTPRTVGYNCGILAPVIHPWLRGSAVCVTFLMLRWWAIPLLWDQWTLQQRTSVRIVIAVNWCVTPASCLCGIPPWRLCSARLGDLSISRCTRTNKRTIKNILLQTSTGQHMPNLLPLFS